MTIAIEASEVSWHSDSRVIIDRVSAKVAPGEIVGIVGPNGAGKSTFLRLLAGDLNPTSGSVLLLGMDASHSTPADLAPTRAFLAAGTSSPNGFNVRDIVEMGRHPHRQSRIDSSVEKGLVDAAMAAAGIRHLEWRRVDHLSGGERQSVGLARVIAQHTPILLLDEPTSSLDIATQEKSMAALRQIADRGAAIAVVLHDLNLAAAHTDHLLLFEAGRVAASGSPADVLTAERLSAVYQQPMAVVPHPFRDCVLVLTIDEAATGSTS